MDSTRVKVRGGVARATVGENAGSYGLSGEKIFELPERLRVRDD